MPVVHAAPVATVRDVALPALAPLRPAPVAELPKAILPHLPKIVFINIALPEDFPVDIWASTDGAVYQHRRYIDAGMAKERVLPHLHLVRPQIPLAAESDIHECLSACGVPSARPTMFECLSGGFSLRFDELHQLHQLPIREVQLLMVTRPADGYYRE